MGYVSVTHGLFQASLKVQAPGSFSEAFSVSILLLHLFYFLKEYAFYIGAVSGSALSGWMLDSLGRKPTLWISGLLTTLSGLGIGLRDYALGHSLAFFSEGLAVGIACVASPVYIAELAPSRFRGTLVCLFQLAVTLGILLGYHTASQGQAGAFWGINAATLAGVTLVIGIPWLPESPIWLVARGKTAQAKASLKRLWNVRRVKRATTRLSRSIYRQKSLFPSMFCLEGSKILALGILVAVFQQASGINAVLYHAPQILISVGFRPMDAGIMSTYWIGALNLVFTLVALSLLDSWGRRPLILLSVGLLVVSLNLIDLVFVSPGLFGGKTGALVAIGLFVGAFAMGLGPILWVYTAELFPFILRAKGASILAAVHWLANVSLQMSLHSSSSGSVPMGDFWVYAILMATAWVVLYALLPETSQRPLEMPLMPLRGEKDARF
jgi:SP family arabinose:H+ symporter-like MFS transporter